MLLKIADSPVYQKFPCPMKRKGIRIQKRKICDDLIENFHKKLKINSEEPATEFKESSTALILYKEPTPPIPALPVEILDKLKREIGPPIENLILSKEHLMIEEIFKIETEEIKEKESDFEMEVD